MVDNIENPYTKMTEDVLQTHLTQMSEVVKAKQMDVKQFFGIAQATISPEDQSKIDAFGTLTSEVEKLTKESAAKNLSPEAVQISQIGVDSVLSQIKALDPTVDLSSVGSKFNNLEKISILNDVKPIIEKYVGQVASIKKELDSKTGSGSTNQQFGAPEDTSSAEAIIQEMTKINTE